MKKYLVGLMLGVVGLFGVGLQNADAGAFSTVCIYNDTNINVGGYVEASYIQGRANFNLAPGRWRSWYKTGSERSEIYLTIDASVAYGSQLNGYRLEMYTGNDTTCDSAKRYRLISSGGLIAIVYDN